MHKEKSCGVIIYRDRLDTQYLVVKSKANGHWGFPKGHIEGTETEIDAARREVKEETGLDVLIHEGFKTSMEYIISEKNKRKQLILFLGTPSSNSLTIQTSEIAAYKWAPFTDAINLFKYEDHKQVLKLADEFLRQNFS